MRRIDGPQPGLRENAPAEVEPDYRFTLANERTFLAWIRTALALVAGGLVVDQFVQPVGGIVPTITAISCVLLAFFTAAGAYFRWQSVQQAMRRAAPLPGTRLLPLLSVGTSAVIASAAVAVILR